MRTVALTSVPSSRCTGVVSVVASRRVGERDSAVGKSRERTVEGYTGEVTGIWFRYTSWSLCGPLCPLWLETKGWRPRTRRLSKENMQVKVLFFGMLKDLAGQASDSLTLREGATLGDVLSHYEARIPQLKRLLPSLALSVNREYAAPEVRLKPDDEIALLPPVSGGSPSSSSEASEGKTGGARCCASIVHERIDTQAVLDRIKRPEDGAAVVFDGVARNNTRGRRTLYLDYEAYEAMALKKMEELAGQALRQFPVREVAIVHRLGRLEIGETSVLIVVASAHRGSAFDACRWLIDTLKRTVPIWKKEYFEDGAVWADGEPFPPEIVRAEGVMTEKPASK
jgi:molybdopterin synthase catalytic subunit/molybdopterin converting factor small subunit